MSDDLFHQRMHAAGLSLWELGDLLGIHPHHLHAYDTAGSLPNQPVLALIELAARLDLHPADLVPALERVLTNLRQPRAATSQPADLDTEALGVLTALATSGEPLTTDELTTALGWTLDRTAAAIEHAVDRPHLAGPVALRRIPPDRWTLTPRRDILSAEQQQAVLDAARYRTGLTVTEADALLAAHALGNTDDYAGWRREHLGTEHHLKTIGLLRGVNGPHRAELHPDVTYSLSRRE